MLVMTWAVLLYMCKPVCQPVEKQIRMWIRSGKGRCSKVLYSRCTFNISRVDASKCCVGELLLAAF